jgi:hypothetical protein
MVDSYKKESLKTVFSDPNASIYKIKGPFADHIQRYIFTTPETRKILNDTSVTGFDFTSLLTKGLTRLLENFPFSESMNDILETDCNVFNFLRGGLNFGINEALYNAWGFNNVSSSFMTSQRDKDPEGRWFIKDDQYQKFTFSKDAVIFCGDIVATGSTVENGFERLFKLAHNLGHPIRNVIFFTFGCHKIEKILERYHLIFKKNFKRYRDTYLFYIEGKFKLADFLTDLHIKIQGTDLLRYPALIAPEFELSQHDSLVSALERCIIYDGGTRKFEVHEYLKDVSEYWRELRNLARKRGWTYRKALLERWPEEEYNLDFNQFSKEKRIMWPDADQSFLQKLYTHRQNKWSRLGENADDPVFFENFCNKRLEFLDPIPKKLEDLKKN